MNSQRLPSQLLPLWQPGIFEEERAHLERLQTMFDQELVQPQPHIAEGVWYARYRRILVDWIAEKVSSEPLRLTNFTTHVAVHYLDRVLSAYQVEPQRLQLVACACVLVAAKMEEIDVDIPSLNTVCQAAEGQYSVELLFQMELELLSFLEWKTSVLTAVHFIGHFMPFALSPHSDSIRGAAIAINSPVLDHVERYAEFFADFCLQDYSFCRYRHSVLAAACIYCARQALNITPRWSEVLAHYTTYNLAEIAECVEHMWSTYLEAFPNHARQPNAIIAEISPNSVTLAQDAVFSMQDLTHIGGNPSKPANGYPPPYGNSNHQQVQQMNTNNSHNNNNGGRRNSQHPQQQQFEQQFQLPMFENAGAPAGSRNRRTNNRQQRQ